MMHRCSYFIDDMNSAVSIFDILEWTAHMQLGTSTKLQWRRTSLYNPKLSDSLMSTLDVLLTIDAFCLPQPSERNTGNGCYTQSDL